ATDEILRAYDEGWRRATAVLPGGAGKTVLGLRVAEALAARGELRSALVLLPMILGYTAYAYWVFRGKTEEGEGYH
ncbi:MAG: hypothetical protein VXW43_17215, partial [Pseudomonadota bacterium]|nr:hypothetical protein [Pseudomonadota bacterium]